MVRATAAPLASIVPKLAQPDYTETLTKLLQANPQAIYSCIWGGDLPAFIDQA